ncbi:hypothetical protein ACPEEZ_09635 [Frigoribacterium sp. 2-23]|uniref:hypothetical protein n=1 Tax=Frigoribacterium sp. 2-23 TaxID=3415006 RepID=UPI003C6ED6BD
MTATHLSGPRHRAVASAAPTRRAARRPARRSLQVSAVLLGAVVVGLLSTGGSYALWNGTAQPAAGAVTSGTTGLTITSPSFDLTRLTPGQPVVTTFVVTNTGDVPLSLSVKSTGWTAQYDGSTTGASLDTLSLRLNAVASSSDCRVGLGGGYSAPLKSFDTGTGYFTLPAKRAATGCLEVSLSTNSPSSAQGAVDTVQLTVSGTQATS